MAQEDEKWCEKLRNCSHSSGLERGRMYNLIKVAKNLGTKLKNAMRNYEKELLEQLRNYSEPEQINDDSDEELAEIWTLTGNMVITDIGDNAFTSQQDNSTRTLTGNMVISDISDNAFTSQPNNTTTTTSNSTHRGDNRLSDTNTESDTLTDNYMRYIDTNSSNNVENKLDSSNSTDLDINKNVNDDADDEGSDSDVSSDCDSDDDDDDDDDMFDVCIRESLSRRCKVMPYSSVHKSYYDFDDDDDDDDLQRPLTIHPIKRRYSVQESLRVMVLRSEAAKVVKTTFSSRRTSDS